MRIHLGANYLGYELGRALEAWLDSTGFEVVWHGAPEFDNEDDYPLYSIRVGQAVIEDEDAGVPARGIIVGETGAPETIVANKVNGSRAVPGLSKEFVIDARQHADANILILGQKLIQEVDARELVTVFLAEDFLNILDDARRIINTAEFETSGTIEGWMIEYSSGSSGPKGL
ncbi:RpiB/LacA/LacB family sugar-phosphate isomerase [Aurantimicrobium photophilum]|uniref:Ribose-5-phosphate isomerase B n=1 Tax=Aurantimicrobium photophilum TaxID=1987356 RepID=A0A2Z3RUS4_9MICO|nr:RpiB/LacA/LacB family sugar-phosphate isomerase [Aurantimicrobium photophilum]AWR20675.1 Ribose-5-phosphate isomerase B [Aurantimicrobium photophilum]